MSQQYPYGFVSDNGEPLRSPRLRQQPPSLLTTSLNNNAQQLGLGLSVGVNGQTPQSSTSLSSPFSLHHASPYPEYGNSARGTSPMASRGTGGFNSQYNPQQWGPIANENAVVPTIRSTFIVTHPRQSSSRVTTISTNQPRGPDEPVASPPPPYSPQRPSTDSQDSDRSSITPSPSDTMSPRMDTSVGNTPTTAGTTLSAYDSNIQRDHRSPRSSLIAQRSISPLAGSVASFPPPPPPTGNRVRSSSKNHADRLIAAVTGNRRNTNPLASVNAIDALRANTVQALGGAPEDFRMEPAIRPPASRRAASTGAIGLSASASRSAVSLQPPVVFGMPLPPPPPGPPPAGSRSQSVSRPLESYSSVRSPPEAGQSRQRPSRGTGLETVPPTPADWRDEETGNESTWPNRRPTPEQLRVKTQNIACASVSDISPEDHSMQGRMAGPSHTRAQSSGGMLLRSPAVRNRSAKGIRERRSESRSGRAQAAGASEDHDGQFEALISITDVKPLDLVIPANGNTISNRRASAKSTPMSAGNMPASMSASLLSAKGHLNQMTSLDSSYSTPRQDSTRFAPYLNRSTPTPPFSPGRAPNQKYLLTDEPSPRLPPTSLPTPPLQPARASHDGMQLMRPSHNEIRPISHILHTPVPEIPTQVMSSRPGSSLEVSHKQEVDSPSKFAQRATERHRKFIEDEAAASNDSERLHLFIEYMLAESRIRRERYASTFEEEKIDPAELVIGMFDVSAETPHIQNMESISRNLVAPKEDSRRSSGTEFSVSPGRNPSTAATSDMPLKLDTNIPPHHQMESSRWNDYVPVLSPIASMSAVTGRDEMDSRGRAPSRWWENESRESSHDGFKVLERSKRESKYMGVGVRDSPAVNQPRAPSHLSHSYENEASSSRLPAYGSDEYPPEKTGWHEKEEFPSPAYQPPMTPRSAPYTPNPRRLDISRLVTLPPPYPRHHPAVKNSHPQLASFRADVTSLNDLSEAETIRQSYQTQVVEKRQRADSWKKHQRSLHDQDMQYRMEHGEISQQQYDQAEAEVEAKEAQNEKELIQTDFDLFQKDVVTPLHALFSEGINKASISFDQLNDWLSTDAQSRSPNLPQEEGDEQPELLEKLTQLKRLFEARENLHRQIYELLSERNEKYKAIVFLPYERAQNHEKLADAKDFFAKDALNRKLAAETASLQRYQSCLSIIESHVTRGVEIQLSAFWDIAPSLLSLLQQVPLHDLRRFEILIPKAELDENPAYWTYPLRYLYSLVCHAESSSRQFIESQVSLWCLLHEVREATIGIKWRIEECKGDIGGWEAATQKAREERALTEDLKEKVGVVESQWEEALGEKICGVKDGLRGYLTDTGGWDEELEEV
ncbi:MAG: hypothetical protein MMC33_001813 [Icmadophila ericetorum]|nr:hypothetical protein [Icmadophila ericetorum]